MRTTPEVARKNLEAIVQNSSEPSGSMRKVIQIVLAIRMNTPLQSELRLRAEIYRKVLEDPQLRAAVYHTLDQNRLRKLKHIDRMRTSFRINRHHSPNGSRRQSPKKFHPK